MLVPSHLSLKSNLSSWPTQHCSKPVGLAPLSKVESNTVPSGTLLMPYSLTVLRGWQQMHSRKCKHMRKNSSSRGKERKPTYLPVSSSPSGEVAEWRYNLCPQPSTPKRSKPALNIKETVLQSKGFQLWCRKSRLNAIARFSNHEKNNTPFLYHKPITLFRITYLWHSPLEGQKP